MRLGSGEQGLKQGAQWRGRGEAATIQVPDGFCVERRWKEGAVGTSSICLMVEPVTFAHDLDVSRRTKDGSEGFGLRTWKNVPFTTEMGKAAERTGVSGGRRGCGEFVLNM